MGIAKKKYEFVYLYAPYPRGTVGWGVSFFDRSKTKQRLVGVRASRIASGQRCGAIVRVPCPPTMGPKK